MSYPIDVAKPNRPISEPSPFRVSEVVSALTLALDLGEGQPLGHSVRTCVLGMRLAQEIGLPQGSQGDLYYALLMKSAGSSSHTSALFQSSDGWSEPPHAKEQERELARVRCDVGALIARRMGLSEQTASAIRSMDEHWNGDGNPNGVHGEEIPLMARILSLAQTLEVSHAAGGPLLALDTARQRSGSWFDPELVRAAHSLAAADALWAGMADADRRVIEMEPLEKPLDATEATLDQICEAFSEVIDTKAPFVSRHSTAVAGTATFIAQILGLRESDVTLLRRAALLHDIGKLGISNSILEKPGKLTSEEWVELRKHAFYSYAILKRVPGFGELSEIAGSHHEKLDGSGYFRGLKAEQLSLPTRILVIADIYDALSAKRPYRNGLPPELALQMMKQQAPHALDATCLDALMRSLDPETSNAAGLAQLSANLQHN